MKQLTFGQLKYMDRDDLKDNEFLLKQDLNPKYCTEQSEGFKIKKKMLNYIKFLLYNPKAQVIPSD